MSSVQPSSGLCLDRFLLAGTVALPLDSAVEAELEVGETQGNLEPEVAVVEGNPESAVAAASGNLEPEAVVV